MDLYCPICGEPCDNDEFHDYAKQVGSTYAKVASDFRKRGCEAVDMTHSEVHDEGMANSARAMYELLGDDMDGAAAMLADVYEGWD